MKTLLDRTDQELREAAEAAGHRIYEALRARRDCELAHARARRACPDPDGGAARERVMDTQFKLDRALDAIHELAGLPLTNPTRMSALGEFRRALRAERDHGHDHGPVDGMWQTGAESSDAWSRALDAGVTEAELSAEAAAEYADDDPAAAGVRAAQELAAQGGGYTD